MYKGQINNTLNGRVKKVGFWPDKLNSWDVLQAESNVLARYILPAGITFFITGQKDDCSAWQKVHFGLDMQILKELLLFEWPQILKTKNTVTFIPRNMFWVLIT